MALRTGQADSWVLSIMMVQQSCQLFRGMLSPIGFFQFLIVPFANDSGVQFLRILAFETPDTLYYQVPFAGFWGVVHLLFWCAWININVGIFNAIPMIPLDGGYIFKEGVDRLLDRRGLLKYSSYVTSAVSYLMLGCPGIADCTAVSAAYLNISSGWRNGGFLPLPLHYRFCEMIEIRIYRFYPRCNFSERDCTNPVPCRATMQPKLPAMICSIAETPNRVARTRSNAVGVPPRWT